MANGQTLEELVSRWTIDADLTPLEQARKGLEGLTVSLGAIAASVGAAAAGLFGIAHATAEAGEEAMKAGLKYGVSASAFQELTYAARDDAEALTMGLQFLNRNMAAAAGGAKESAKAFNQLGVSFGSNGAIRDTDTVLMELADKFKKMPNDAKRTAAAIEIFGRSGASMLPFLTQGRDEIEDLRKEAIEFGFVIQDTEAANHFDDMFVDLTNIARGFRNMIGVQLIPVISDLMEEMKQWLRLNREWIVQDIGDYVQLLLKYIRLMYAFLANFIGALDKMVKIFGGWKKVIQGLTVATGIFLATLALFNLGRLAMGVAGVVTQLYAMAAGMGTAGNAALLAQAKMLLMPILIGAAILVILAMLEDLWTFFNGGESVIGDWVSTIKGMFISLEEMFDGMGTWAKVLVTVIATPFRVLFNLLDTVLTLIKAIFGYANFADAGAKFGGMIAGALGMDSKGGFVGKTLSGALGLGDSGFGNPAGFTPSFSPAVGATDSSKNVNQNTTINQTIMAGDGSNALATGAAASNMTKTAMDQVNRQSAKTFTAPGDY